MSSFQLSDSRQLPGAQPTVLNQNLGVVLMEYALRLSSSSQTARGPSSFHFRWKKRVPQLSRSFGNEIQLEAFGFWVARGVDTSTPIKVFSAEFKGRESHNIFREKMVMIFDSLWFWPGFQKA